MYGSAEKPVLRRLLIAFLTLCLLALGVAPHTPRSGAPASPASLAAASGIDLSLYTLPDGTIPDLCLTLHADAAEETGHGAHEGVHCPACSLTKTVLATAPATIARAVAYAITRQPPAIDARALRRERASPHWARGPPQAAHV
ncbi:MAG: hypothetical protein MEP57_05415 [Microvirga sp.]|nr:hypothetical protein [Microvirga sp.]